MASIPRDFDYLVKPKPDIKPKPAISLQNIKITFDEKLSQVSVFSDEILFAKYFVKDAHYGISVTSMWQKYDLHTNIRYDIVDKIKEWLHSNKLDTSGRLIKSGSKQEEECTMDTIISVAKKETIEAAKRESVNAAWDILKHGIIEMGLEGLSDDRAKQIKEILESKLGDIFLRIIVGAALEQFSNGQSKNDWIIELLTKELRIQGYQKAIGSYMNPLIAIVNDALKSMNPLANET